MNETIHTLLERRSVRRYRPDAVEEEKLRAILEAGLYAPSAMARQSVTLVAVEDRETLDHLERENAAIQGDPAGKPFYGAPMAVAVLTDPEATNAVNGQRDGALALGAMMNAAWSLGVGSCWINRAQEFFASAQGKEQLRKWGLPERLEGVGFCVLGYAAQKPAPAAPRREGRVVRV